MDDSIIKFSNFFYNYEQNMKSIESFSPILKCIFDNLNDFQSRFLMIISNNSMQNFLIDSLLKQENKKYKILIGSKFDDDIEKEFYTIKKLNEIQSYLYENKILNKI